MSLVLKFLGAADGVSGSRSLLQHKNKTWMIDCGLFQGPKAVRERNRQPSKPSPDTLAAILLTHAHLDHSGFLPRICHEGYQGDILCTPGTADLCRILLRDAAHLEEEAAKYADESRYSKHYPAIPLFTQEDAELAIGHLKPQPRNTWNNLSDHVRYKFLRAGHIIGASLIQFEIRDGRDKTIVTFSGDLGHNHSFILRGPQEGIETDVLVLESTYGNRLHPRTDTLEVFSEVYRRTMERGGVLVIPAFAVGRAQELTYMIRLLEDQRRIPVVPVILDSPMSVAAMEVCLNHHEDRLEASGQHDELFKPERFEVSTTPDQSMLACMRDGPLVVISASGMLSGGRILHHLKHRLPDPKNTVLFSGYQAEETKGRYLQDNAGKIAELRIHHQLVAVNAEIATLEHLSAHADQEDLLTWISRMRQLPKQIIVNHGSIEAQAALAAAIQKRFGIAAKTAHEQRELVVD